MTDLSSSNALVPPLVSPSTDMRARLAARIDEVLDLSEEVLPENTRLAQRRDWDRFATWCELHAVSPLPAAPDSLLAYLLEPALDEASAGFLHKPATLRRWLTTIKKVHDEAGLPSPTVDPRVSRLLRRLRAAHPDKGRQRRVAALDINALQRTLAVLEHDTWPAGAAATRDAAALLVLMAGAMRRSELVDLDWGDITPVNEHGEMLVRVRRSKTDQAGMGLSKVLVVGLGPSTCAPCAITRWAHIVAAVDAARPKVTDEDQYSPDPKRRARALTQARRTAAHEAVRRLEWDSHCCEAAPPQPPSGTPVMRRIDKHGTVGAARMDGGSIARVVKKRVAAAGLDPTRFSGHSPRAGHVTTALRNEVPYADIRVQTGHASDAMLVVYDREDTPGRRSSAKRLGL